MHNMQDLSLTDDRLFLIFHKFINYPYQCTGVIVRILQLISKREKLDRVKKKFII